MTNAKLEKPLVGAEVLGDAEEVPWAKSMGGLGVDLESVHGARVLFRICAILGRLDALEV